MPMIVIAALVALTVIGSSSLRVILNWTEGDHSRAEQIDAGTAVHGPLQRLDACCSPMAFVKYFGHAFPIAPVCAFVAVIEHDPHR
jgi:hypothetical protein